MSNGTAVLVVGTTGTYTAEQLLGSHFKGNHASLSALQTAHATGQAGDYAHVDAGASTDTLQYIWDVSDSAWIVNAGTPGAAGTNGTDGNSAFEIAVAAGYTGTQTEWLASLVGADGTNGTDGADGADGDSAYTIAQAQGYSGTVTEWLATLVGPTGATGADGAATVTIGTVTTGAAGSSVTVTNSGTSTAATLDFSIPQGDTGAAATIAVGTVTTGAAGSSVTFTNSGTSAAAVFDVTIPRGDTGATGPAGADGAYVNDGDVETAYHNRVPLISASEVAALSGTSTRRVTPDLLRDVVNNANAMHDDTGTASQVTFDLSESMIKKTTLLGNATLAVSHVVPGKPFIIVLRQDSTGTRVPTWWSNIIWMDGGTAPTLTTTAHKYDVFGFIPDEGAGTSYFGFVLGQDGG